MWPEKNALIENFQSKSNNLWTGERHIYVQEWFKKPIKSIQSLQKDANSYNEALDWLRMFSYPSVIIAGFNFLWLVTSN